MLKFLRALITEPQWGIALALLLVVLPLTQFLGVALAVLLLLRRGDVYGQVGFVLVAVLIGFASNGYTLNGYTQTVWGVAFYFIPLWVMAMVLRRVQSLAFSIEAGTLVLMIMVAGAAWIVGSPTAAAIVDYWHTRGIDLYSDERVKPEVFAAVFELAWPLLVMLFQVLVLLFARWLQACMYYPSGFKADFHQLRLHKPMAALALILLVLGVVAPGGGITAASLLLEQLAWVSAVYLSLAGLGIVHWYVAFKGWSSFWLVGIYLIILIVPQVAVLVLGVNALVDSFFNIRQRVIAAKQRGM